MQGSSNDKNYKPRWIKPDCLQNLFQGTYGDEIVHFQIPERLKDEVLRRLDKGVEDVARAIMNNIEVYTKGAKKGHPKRIRLKLDDIRFL